MAEYLSFRDIVKLPKAHYRINVLWTGVEVHIANAQKRHPKLDLEPDFQRAHVWTREQQVKYVEYILQGGELGKNLVFNCPGWLYTDDGPYVIVDGKQRLEAVRSFLRNDFEVFGQYCKRFGNLGGMTGPEFIWCVGNLNTREEILRLYLNINAGGTPHTQEELQRVRELLHKEIIDDD